MPTAADRGTVVCDASALVALLLDDGDAGTWATQVLRAHALAAPHLVGLEAANILRRQELAGRTSADQAAQAHADLLDLVIELWPYEPLAARSRELRGNLTVYAASYVALAELLDAPLVTLDRAIARSPGVRCRVETP